MNEWYSLVTIALGVFGGIWSLAWWLSGKFSDVRGQIYAEASRTRNDLTTKIEYHEKHDDRRFDQVVNEIWAIKMRNASRDGLPVEPVYKTSNIRLREAIDPEDHKETKPQVVR